MAMIWCRNMVNYQRLPSPAYYGWKNDVGFLTLIMTLNSPAPRAVIDLVKCGCRILHMKGCAKLQLWKKWSTLYRNVWVHWITNAETLSTIL